MNNRIRMQMKALGQRQKPPIMAIIRNDHGKFNHIVFIHPDHWDEALAKYGDKVIDVWNCIGGKYGKS